MLLGVRFHKLPAYLLLRGLFHLRGEQIPSVIQHLSDGLVDASKPRAVIHGANCFVRKV
jgi:hypothetical protein